jgi:hypothetical protein
MRARQVLAVILAAFAAVSVIAALTTIRRVRMESQERPFSYLLRPHQQRTLARFDWSPASAGLRIARRESGSRINAAGLVHDPEKREAVFRKDHAQTTI